MLRLPVTYSRSLICFASRIRAILFASCLATCAPGRSEGPSGPGSLFNRRPDLPVCSHADVSGISQVSRRSILCLCPALATPAEPTIPRLLDGFVDAVPALPTAKTSAVNEFRGSVTRLWHPLPTLQESCCHHPCKARFRLAGLAFYREGVEPSGSLQKVSQHPSSFSGLSLAQGKFHFEAPSRFTSLDHLVGACEQRRWHVEARRLGVLSLHATSLLQESSPTQRPTQSTTAASNISSY